MNTKIFQYVFILFLILLQAEDSWAEDIKTIELQIESETFHNFELIESNLRRGDSTKEDVRRLLGEPNGDGGAFLPFATEANNAWFYEEVKSKAGAGGSLSDSAIRVKMFWQIAIIFFNGELFDGYLWFTSGRDIKSEESE